MESELAETLALLLPCLDERQQRLVLGAVARVRGHGGIRLVAGAAGVAESTVSRGLRELVQGAVPDGRVRAAGAGRKRLRDIDPDLVPALLALVEPEERGDPQSPLRWTVKSTRALAAELSRQGHWVGHDTVAGLLRSEGFSLQGTSRTTEGARHPDRDAQFRYINEQATAHLADGQPVISVDAKKKETLGRYAVGGREWHRAGQPVEVRAHDFPEKGALKAVPYGIYDIGTDAGWVSVGCDGDTAAFAVATLRRWWDGEGRHRYPDASRLLITADAGGSNGYRVRAWKRHLAEFALATGLSVSVCHFPPGTSKWNKIEHRLFSQISINWRGRPLTSHEVVVNTIGATRTRTGLTVHAELDPDAYPTGVTVPDDIMERLPLTPHEWHGTWNYTLRPEPLAPFIQQPRDRAFGRFPAGDKLPAWLRHPSLTGLEPAAFDDLVTRYRTWCDEHPPILLPGKRPDGGPGAGGRRLSAADHLTVFLLAKRWTMAQAPLAEATGLTKNRIGATLRETTPVLAALSHTVPTGPLTVTSAQQLAQIAGHNLTAP
ncbi:ISAzo13 family transposase [Streptomyces sp. NBC_01264]|nr:ISAzo13 family transposase [Streptomyces sp. NBC_01264]MCX4781664.1 ISAzo13 family transposase [Streptomyces sp. NBC_01264]MCX4781665.1 ISAzo13 family transposase [Streptomyces sp. NBC_01264]MCX4782697.1 ISAzo13 family transposase [Streptomyces sp. NBC_01264]